MLKRGRAAREERGGKLQLQGNMDRMLWEGMHVPL